jgi:hypothetical protein
MKSNRKTNAISTSIRNENINIENKIYIIVTDIKYIITKER